jgi:hypothetical protein
MRRDASLIETDDEPSLMVRAEIIDWLNQLRAKAGRPPLSMIASTDPRRDSSPELEPSARLGSIAETLQGHGAL